MTMFIDMSLFCLILHHVTSPLNYKIYKSSDLNIKSLLPLQWIVQPFKECSKLTLCCVSNLLYFLNCFKLYSKDVVICCLQILYHILLMEIFNHFCCIFTKYKSFQINQQFAVLKLVSKPALLNTIEHMRKRRKKEEVRIMG